MGTPTTLTIPTHLPEGREIPSPFDRWTPQAGTEDIGHRMQIMKRLKALHAAANTLLDNTIEHHPHVFEPPKPGAPSNHFEYTDELPEGTERIRVHHSKSLGGITTWSCIEPSPANTEGTKLAIDHGNRRLLVWHNLYNRPERELHPAEWREDPIGTTLIFVESMNVIKSLTNYLGNPAIQPTSILPDPG